MVSFLSDYLRDLLIAGTWPATPTLYFGLGTNIPEPSDTGLIEPSGGSYSRIAYTSSTNTNWTQLASSLNPTMFSGTGLYANVLGVQFPAAAGNWGTIQTIGLFNQLTGGNLLFAGELPPVSLTVGSPGLYFPPLAIKAGLISRGARRAGFSSDYLNDYMMGHLFNGLTAPALTQYLALCTKMPQPSDTGGTMTEVANAGAYARQSLSSWSDFIAGRYYNNAAIAFPLPTALWGTILAFAVVDALSIGTGNLLWGGPINPPLTINSGSSPVNFPVGTLQVGLGCGW